MITVTEAHVVSEALPSAFFDRWADMATWPEWNTDTAWVRLDGPFATGSTGELKPKGGPKVRFVLESVVPGSEFIDVSLLLGARLTFAHTVSVLADGRTAVAVVVTLEGPLARLWHLFLGKGFRSSAQPDLDRLAAACSALA